MIKMRMISASLVDIDDNVDDNDIYTDYKMTKMMMVIKMRRGWMSEYQRESRKWM